MWFDVFDLLLFRLSDHIIKADLLSFKAGQLSPSGLSCDCFLDLLRVKRSSKGKSKNVMKSNSKHSNNDIQILFSGTILRIERKATMTKIIRVLLGLVVALTFLGNILFILETRKMNTDGEQDVEGNFGNRPKSALPQRRNNASKFLQEAPSTTKGK